IPSAAYASLLQPAALAVPAMTSGVETCPARMYRDAGNLASAAGALLEPACPRRRPARRNLSCDLECAVAGPAGSPAGIASRRDLRRACRDSVHADAAVAGGRVLALSHGLVAHPCRLFRARRLRLSHSRSRRRLSAHP